MTDRKKPGVAFWVTVVALVGYPLSFGPACWWLSNSAILVDKSPIGGSLEYPVDNDSDLDLGARAPRMYWPVGWLAWHGPRPISRAICWYATAGRRPFDYVWVHVQANGGLYLRF
jgi:hypothetical protein